MPNLTKLNVKGTKVLFPASTVGRKGEYEIKTLAKELDFNLLITGRTLEGDDFWEDLIPEIFDGNYESISLIVYPAYIEHQPRQILKMISIGIPIITTTACGIDSSEKVKVFELRDFDGIKNEIIKTLGKVE